MNLIPIDVDTIQIGRRLPFSLRSSQGALLAKKGFLVESKGYLISIVASVPHRDTKTQINLGRLMPLTSGANDRLW